MAPLPYRHHQTTTGWSWLLAFVVLAILAFAAVLSGSVGVAAILSVAILLVLAIWVALSSLTTTVDDREIEVAFRFGWPCRTIPIESIEHHEQVRNRWWYGWGIRLVPGGMLYNVWGLDAVAVTYRSDGKSRTLRIGSDDPAGLADAITRARSR